MRWADQPKAAMSWSALSVSPPKILSQSMGFLFFQNENNPLGNLNILAELLIIGKPLPF